jgi:guanylate kinase
MSHLIAVIGPSGGGKSSMVRELHRRGLVHVHPTWTTRPRRTDELNGTLEHRFVTDEVFDLLCAQELFLATATFFGLPWRYGLPRVENPNDGRIGLVMLRAPAVELLREQLALSLVIQVEADDQRIARRLLARGSSPDEIAARLVDNRHEVALGRTLADVTLRNDHTIESLAASAARAISQHLRDASLTAAGSSR